VDPRIGRAAHQRIVPLGVEFQGARCRPCLFEGCIDARKLGENGRNEVDAALNGKTFKGGQNRIEFSHLARGQRLDAEAAPEVGTHKRLPFQLE
jgi:hypothetical protein